MLNIQYSDKSLPFDWNDARVARLKKRHADGWSAGRIAAELTVTRNAVIGKIQRLGLGGGGAPLKWTPEKETRLVELYKRGDSYRQIGEAIGFSGRAVEYKVKQMDLAKTHGARKQGGKPGMIVYRSAVQGMTPAQRLARRRELEANRAKVIEATPPADFLALTFDQLNVFSRRDVNRCRFPRGEGADMRFCGQNSIPGKAYCPGCQRVAWRAA